VLLQANTQATKFVEEAHDAAARVKQQKSKRSPLAKDLDCRARQRCKSARAASDLNVKWAS
jgi:hypothetical protein